MKTKSTTSKPTAQSGKKAKEVVDDAPPKKKKKELRLPNARTDDAEDGEIEWLEYTLRNEKGKEEESDGLDGECTLALEWCRTNKSDLLDFADMIGPGGKGLKRDREDDGEDEDGLDFDDEDEDDFGLGMDSEDEDEEEDEEDGDSDLHDTDPDDLSDAQLTDSAFDDGEEIDLSENDESKPSAKEIEATETPKPATKYVPPHMRAAQLAEKAQGSKEKALSRQKLERKLQGLLNK
jgi:nucleolar MIF4G domain-containing protein 1